MSTPAENGGPEARAGSGGGPEVTGVAAPPVHTVVLYAHRIHNPTATGIGRYVTEVIARLESLEEPGILYRRASSPDRVGRGTEGRAWWQPTGPREALHASWSLVGRPRVDRWLAGPDLIHVLYPSTPVPSSCPAVYTIHDLMPLRQPGWYRRREVWAFRRAVAAARRAAAVVAVSAAVAGELTAEQGFDADRVHVVHPGVAGEYFAAVDEQSVAAACAGFGLAPSSYLIAVGALRTRKNLEAVVRALPLVPEVRLLCVGPSGEGGPALHRLVGAHGLESRVTFAGWLPPHVIPPLVKGAAALVHPSREEGFGMTPLEAMALGVPTVVRRQRTTDEVVGRAARVVEGDDPEAWAEALRVVLGDDSVRADLVEAGRDRASGFTWDATAERLAAVHRLCLARPAGCSTL